MFLIDCAFRVTAALLAGSAVCLSSGCGRDVVFFDDTPTPADVVFRYTVAEPLSITATDIQGGADIRGLISVNLRFRPSTPLAKLLLDRGYKEVPFKDVEGRFEVDSQLQGRFSPDWRPSPAKHARCFFKNSANRWADACEDYYLVDEDTGLVYFCCQGRVPENR